METAGTDPLANIEFPLHFTVTAAPATVDVKVDTVDKPITKNTGSDVFVKWNSAIATWCTCTCRDPITILQ